MNPIYSLIEHQIWKFRVSKMKIDGYKNSHSDSDPHTSNKINDTTADVFRYHQ